MIISSSRKTLVAAVAALLALVALVAHVHASRADSPSTVSQASSSLPTYSVLGSSSAPTDASVTQSTFVTGFAVQHPELGIQAAGARMLQAVSAPSKAATALAVVPGKVAPCLYVARSGSEHLSCGTTPGETALVTYNGSIGVVPDSVKSVTFTMSDDSQQVVSVTNDVWQSPLEASKVTFTLDGTVHTIDLLPHSTVPAGAQFAG